LTLLVSAVTLTGIDLGFQNVARGAAIKLALTAACTDHAGGGAGRWLRSRRPSPQADRLHEGRM
jgi:hypothetical protein